MYTSQLTDSAAALAKKVQAMRGRSRSCRNHESCPVATTTTTSSSADQTMRCATTCSGGTAISAFKYSGKSPQMPYAISA
jgi:hypothetical protein